MMFLVGFLIWILVELLDLIGFWPLFGVEFSAGILLCYWVFPKKKNERKSFPFLVKKKKNQINKVLLYFIRKKQRFFRVFFSPLICIF